MVLLEKLTPTEAEILQFLMRNKTRFVSPEEIYASVWKADPVNCHAIVAVHICHLRQKIKEDPECPSSIETKRNAGYRYLV